MKPLKISSFLFLFILMLILTGCSPSQQNKEKKFNILLISIDTLRADRLHCFGSEYKTSPRIDALAKKSLFFEFAFCPIPKTSASFASMMTGLHPFIHKTKPNLGVLEDKYITLAEALKLKGYHTAAVVDNVNLSKKFSFDQGFDSYTEVWNETEEKTGSTPFITEKVLAFLKKRREKPFFLWANYIETHTPYLPPQKYVAERPPGRDIREIKKKVVRNHMNEIIEAESIYNEGHYIALYDGAVRYVDAEVGKIIDTFNKLGLDKNTILIFTADHGEDLGERNFFFDHGPLTFTAASRVPLLVYIPGENPRRIKTPVSTMDIYPTILNLQGLHPPYPLQGIDLLRAQEGRLFFLVGWIGTYGVVQDNFQYVAVEPKFSRRLNLEPDHFYNIFADPYEKHNLFNKYKDEARRLNNEYLKFGEKHGYLKRDRDAPKKKPLTKKELKKLRALGYLK
jgi:arylsulfatase A-like enzyme